MRVFVLEDDPTRIAQIEDNYLRGHDITVIKSCTEAEKFKPPYDLILLDHDLGGRQLEENEDCGLTFVRMVNKKINFGETLIIVHSYNLDGARNMIAELPHSVYAPFGGRMFRAMVKSAIELMKEEV